MIGSYHDKYELWTIPYLYITILMKLTTVLPINKLNLCLTNVKLLRWHWVCV
jgi:hypothetical protein